MIDRSERTLHGLTQARGRYPRLIPVFGVPIVISLWISAAAVGQLQPAGPPELPDQSKQRADGRKLFHRDWLKEGKLNKTGDGLGPMYNDVSCVACHRNGGGGPESKNVHILSLWRPPIQSSKPLRFSPRLVDGAALKIHPNFNPDVNGEQTSGGRLRAIRRRVSSRVRTSFTLHRFHTGDKDAGGRYKRFRYNLVGYDDKSVGGAEIPESRLTRILFTRSIQRRHGVAIDITQRNTPALFGAGLIERVPDSLIIAVARRQRKQRGGISGRIAQTPAGAVGKFGWRGQTATLHDFVLGACANELGLAVPTIDQPAALLFDRKSKRWKVDPDARSQSVDPGDGSVPFGGPGPAIHLDLTEAQCKSLTTFIASLSAPIRAKKLSLPLAKEVARGETLFAKVGCAVCHVPDMKPAIGIYSDLLLHDMGPKLADPLAAIPEINGKTAPGFTGVTGYYGSEALPQIAKITTNVMQEWRTPPLWGVADSAPYLHDGRAQTLDEAIRWHGGEARGSLRKYKRLSKLDRRRVVMFLESLVAPGSTTQPGGLSSPGFGAGGTGGGFFSVVP